MRLARLALVTMIATVAVPSAAEGPGRHVPARCLEVVERAASESREPGGRADDGAEARWNRSYRLGLRAVADSDLDLAELATCRALVAARDFDARDWRFAETLDQLGLIHYTAGDDELAELMQGAAAAEMLLARGPNDHARGGDEAGRPRLARQSCTSSVRTYLGRLGLVHARGDGSARTTELQAAPHLVLEEGYLPLDAALARRLDWLISQYLLEEDVRAADSLSALRSDILESVDPEAPSADVVLLPR